ncbi:MAG: pyrroline-5-carboxylate reductase [Rhodospirillales bacterium]|jgi:pyrroline-5-carboxylate reductase|nr:pyrroline-5-carboxylate reductase [Rhodospirillales bacterium]MDP6884635.1 pyrroline-5-carboxylate reductase [Rhodospirillales bacterium]
MLTAKLVLVGCGHMGGPLLHGWLERGVEARHVTVVEPDADIARALGQEHSITVHADPGTIAADLDPDVVVLAVKPQIMDSVAPAYRRFAGPHTVFLSIAAGRTLAYFEGHLGAQAGVVRSMPNTPATVRRGVTVACLNDRVQPEQQRLCHDLLESVGEVAWVEDETLLDAVTALSGNGPAYLFLLVECLAAAGIAAGLPKDLAWHLARNTVTGTGELLRRSPHSAAELREQVATPGGTTAAAMEVLMAEGGLEALMTRAVAVAAQRSRDLGKG